MFIHANPINTTIPPYKPRNTRPPLVQNSNDSPLTLPLKPPPLPLGSSNCLLGKKFSRGLEFMLT